MTHILTHTGKEAENIKQVRTGNPVRTCVFFRIYRICWLIAAPMAFGILSWVRRPCSTYPGTARHELFLEQHRKAVPFQTIDRQADVVEAHTDPCAFHLVPFCAVMTAFSQPKKPVPCSVAAWGASGCSAARR